MLVTTLTKRTAEDLTDYLVGVELRVRYLHSDIGAIERVEILRSLRAGEFDILVGINLLLPLFASLMQIRRVTCAVRPH